MGLSLLCTFEKTTSNPKSLRKRVSTGPFLSPGEHPFMCLLSSPFISLHSNFLGLDSDERAPPQPQQEHFLCSRTILATMNLSVFAHDTSMETTETYGTISTSRVLQKKSNLCQPVFRRRCFPSLLDSQWPSSSSSSCSSSCSDSLLNTLEEDTVFMPWDEHQHQTIIHQAVRNQRGATHRCQSATCGACRHAAPPRFVTARAAPQPRLTPKWWEQSPQLTTALADQLGEWVEEQLMHCETPLEHRRFWTAMDEEDDVSTIPYDEKDEDPRYASF